jgi:dTDP-4-dehydrorhamnose reductase
MDDLKILITGGTGTLGKELIKLLKNTNYKIFSPSSQELDVIDFSSCKVWFEKISPDLVIHCAAFTNIRECEINFSNCIDVNIIGTSNVVKNCEDTKARLVYISTDHVFDGKKGNYDTTDYINPITNYAKSKAAGELIVKMYKNSLIIRTSFFGYTFPYKAAFVDQWSSKDYVDNIAPKILQNAVSETTGIVHCGSKKRTIFDIAKLRKPDILGIKRQEVDFFTLEDTSFKE